ncbi:hypothetical protein ACJJI4_17075 [Microbulbifer sp. TRSA002]|uniref:hypothetical protein n=1 Tax=Microbulbifer sp. TRSA002 TaxID=3243382 RepID=UPI004039DEF2
MNQEITTKFNGHEISAEYRVDDDILHVYLPDGDVRTTELRGLNPKSAAMMHLKSYANRKYKSSR